jgi:iodotyrosine deiodinase
MSWRAVPYRPERVPALATLTHTPAPMSFLRQLCGRPANEKPYVLMPVGYPAADCIVPDIHRRPLEEIADFCE